MLCISPAFAVSPYVPVQPDPVLEPWRWTVFPELKGRDLECLAQDREGNIWFGVRGGAIVYDGIDWHDRTSEDVFGNYQVWDLCIARDGSVYAGTHIGIHRYRDGAWEKVFPEQGALPWYVSDILQAGDGSIWAGTMWGALHLSRDGTLLYTTADLASVIVDLAPDLQTVVAPQHAAPARRELSWFSSWRPTLGAWIVWLDGSPRRCLVVQAHAGGPAEAAGLKAGDIVLAVNGDLGADPTVPDGKTARLTVQRKGLPKTVEIDIVARTVEAQFSDFQISDVFEDRDGTIWLGISGYPHDGEILRMEPGGARSGDRDAWRLYTQADGLDTGGWPKVAQTPDGAIWSASGANHHGVNRFDGQRWTTTRLRTFGGSDINPSILVSRDGTLWVGGSHGALHAHREGKWTVYRTPDSPVPSHRVSDLLETSDGTLWIAGRNQEAVLLDTGDRRWTTYGDLNY